MFTLQVFGTNVMVTVAKSFEAPIKCKKRVICSLYFSGWWWLLMD